MNGLLTDWLNSLKQYLRICFFVASPADLPYSRNSLLLTFTAYVLVGVIILGEQYSVPVILGHVAVEIGILYSFSYLVLNYRKRLSRLMQTLSALIGSSLVISLAGIPLNAMLSDNTAAGEPDALTMQLNLALLFWNLAVISLIFKRSYEIPTLLAGFIAFNYFVLYELMVINLFQ